MQDATREADQLLSVITDPHRDQAERLRARLMLCERALIACRNMVEIYQDEVASPQAEAGVSLWRKAEADALTELENVRRELAGVTA